MHFYLTGSSQGCHVSQPLIQASHTSFSVCMTDSKTRRLSFYVAYPVLPTIKFLSFKVYFQEILGLCENA